VGLRVLPVVAALVAVTGCGRLDYGTDTRVVDGVEVFVIQREELDCDDSDCRGAGVWVDNRLYLPDDTCQVPRPELGRVYAVGDDDGEFDVARVVRGVRPQQTLAFHDRRGDVSGCGNGGWSQVSGQSRDEVGYPPP
jgi:hypothetical protein